jgi:hypothetical protein
MLHKSAQAAIVSIAARNHRDMEGWLGERPSSFLYKKTAPPGVISLSFLRAAPIIEPLSPPTFKTTFYTTSAKSERDLQACWKILSFKKPDPRGCF